MNRLRFVCIALAVSLVACSQASSSSSSGDAKPLPESCDTYLAALRSCFVRQQRDPTAIDERLEAQRDVFAHALNRDALAAQCDANARQLRAACD